MTPEIRGALHLPGTLASSSVSPGEVARFTFLQPVPGPGVYLLQFMATVSPSERADAGPEHRSAGVPVGLLNWSVTTVVRVESAAA